MVDRNIIQSCFTKLAIILIDNQCYWCATLDNILILIKVFITSFDKHYYEESDIDVGEPLNCQVSVNYHIELTEEEKAQARQDAIRQYQQEQMNKMRNRDTAKRTQQRAANEVQQPSLFDM